MPAQPRPSRARLALLVLAALLIAGLLPFVAQATLAGAQTPSESETGSEAPSGSETPTDGDGAVEVDRVFGPDRIATAVAISRYEFPDGAEEAYLARADDFADAVSAGSLQRGPVLLVPACGELPVVVADELARLDVRRVVALGGSAAVCDAILDAAAQAADSDGPSETPTDGTETPTDGSETPTDGSETPTDATETPTDGTEAPTDGSETPTDGTGTPTDGSGSPTDGSETPTTGTPSDGESESTVAMAPGEQRTAEAAAAGTVTFERTDTGVRLVSVAPSAGWTYTVQGTSPEVDVTFTSASGRVDLDVEVEDGGLVRIRVREEA